MNGPRSAPPWWLVAVLFALAFAFQGSRAIWEPDEGRYAAVALNMLQSGDYLLPTVDGEHPHLTKPPVTYWALAASFALLGHHEWAARLPGALAFVGTGLLLFGLGRRLCPARPWLPALVWALSLAPVLGANVVSTDALLTLFETAAMLAFVEACAREGAARRAWIHGMWLAWGLAFMTKGPPGLLPLLAMLVFLLAHDRARLRGLFAPGALALFAAAGLTWYVLIVRQQPDRLGYFLGYEVYDRLFTAAHGRNSRWYEAFEVYLPVLVVGTLPWWILALVGCGGPRRAVERIRERIRRRDRDWLLLAYWFFVPLVVFFAAKSRLYLYLLPLFVPLAIILARVLAGWTWLDPRRLAATSAATAIVLVGLKATAAHWPSDRDARAMATAISAIVPERSIDEIAFVDMRGFHGLQMYLGVRIESVQVDEVLHKNVRLITAEQLCDELAEFENNVYAVKEHRADRFVGAVTACEVATIERLGQFDGDGNRIALFRVSPAATKPGIAAP